MDLYAPAEFFASLKKLIKDFDFVTKPLCLVIFVVGIAGFVFGTALLINNYGECTPVLKVIDLYYSKIKTPQDRLLVDDLIGGCTLFKHPKEKVFIDSRFDFYEEDFVKPWKEGFLDGRDYRAFIKKGNFNTFILQKGWFVTCLMNDSADFEKIYEDQHAIIYRLKK